MKTVVILEGKPYPTMPDLNEDDIGQTLQFVVREFDESLVDLTGGTVTFKIKRINETLNKISAVCTLDDPTDGECSYATISGDLDEAGVYDSELQVVLASSTTTIQLGRFKVNIDLP